MESEPRLAMIHRVIVPDDDNADYPKEYAILVTDRRSIFILQPKTRNTYALRGEMKWGTALVTDVTPKTLQDYENTSLEDLSREQGNIVVPHESVVSLSMKADKPTFRKYEFWVKWTMKMQKEIFQVYNFEMRYRKDSRGTTSFLIRFYAVPLGAYFKPRRQTQTREAILRDYAEDLLEIFSKVLPSEKIIPMSNLDVSASME
jgi:hypothetical protein